MMRVITILVVGVFAGYQSLATVCAAGDTELGAEKAKVCAGCHNAMINLNGRGADAIAAQSKAIREGTKPHPPGVEGLSDEEIADIAAYLDGA